MPHVLTGRDYCWLIPANWRIEFRHPPSRQAALYVRTRKVKVKFECSCGHTWTSMEGCLRSFIWRVGDNAHICLMLYQEECQFCQGAPSKDKTTLYAKEFATLIKKVIYDYEHPTLMNPFRVQPTPGKPKSPHQSTYCEACRKHVH